MGRILKRDTTAYLQIRRRISKLRGRIYAPEFLESVTHRFPLDPTGVSLLRRQIVTAFLHWPLGACTLIYASKYVNQLDTRIPERTPVRRSKVTPFTLDFSRRIVTPAIWWRKCGVPMLSMADVPASKF